MSGSNGWFPKDSPAMSLLRMAKSNGNDTLGYLYRQGPPGSGRRQIQLRNISYFPDWLENIVMHCGIRLESSCNITSLRGLPHMVDDFFSSELPITDLGGSIQHVLNDYDVSDSAITSLDGLPQKIEGGCVLENNNQLTSLSGSENTTIGGSLYLVGCPIKNFEYFPKRVGGDLEIDGKTNLVNMWLNSEYTNNIGGQLWVGNRYGDTAVYDSIAHVDLEDYWEGASFPQE